MSLLFFCVCKASRKQETWVSTIRRPEKKAGKLILRKLGKGQGKMLSICHAQLAACFQTVVFSCKVGALSDSTSSLKTHRESDCKTARMSFCKCVKVHNTFCLCAFSFCSTPPSPPIYSHILIHFCVCFAQFNSVLRQFCNCLVFMNEFKEHFYFYFLQGHF